MRYVNSDALRGNVYLWSPAPVSVPPGSHKILEAVKRIAPTRNTLGPGQRLRNRRRDSCKVACQFCKILGNNDVSKDRDFVGAVHTDRNLWLLRSEGAATGPRFHRIRWYRLPLAIHFLSISTVTQVPLLTTSNTGDSLLSALNLSTLSTSVLTLKFTRIS